MAEPTGKFQYDVALSFAGEDREAVAPIARALRSRGVRVFYDEFEKAKLWGKDLQEHLTNVYLQWARHAIVFVSVHYRDKMWPRHELRAALARAMQDRSDYVLPVRVDDTVLDGLLPTIGHVSLREHNSAQVSLLVCEKLGMVTHGRKADEVPPPWCPTASGRVSFDYSNHNGRYQIGEGTYLFETAWTRADDTSIHCYNDPESLKGIALAPVGASVQTLSDVRTLDYSSRVRTPREEQVVVLENSNGFFAALQILEVKDASRGDGVDELSFDYWIFRDGGADFSRIGEGESEDSASAATVGQSSQASFVDKWVSLEYVDRAGIVTDLGADGWELCWIDANHEDEKIDLDGWEYVLRTLADGSQARLKIRDAPAIGGYLVLLKRPKGTTAV